jgi:hypothetical protein
VVGFDTPAANSIIRLDFILLINASIEYTVVQFVLSLEVRMNYENLWPKAAFVVVVLLACDWSFKRVVSNQVAESWIQLF